MCLTARKFSVFIWVLLFFFKVFRSLMGGVFMRLKPFRKSKFSQASDVCESLREEKYRVKREEG